VQFAKRFIRHGHTKKPGSTKRRNGEKNPPGPSLTGPHKTNGHGLPRKTRDRKLTDRCLEGKGGKRLRRMGGEGVLSGKPINVGGTLEDKDRRTRGQFQG